MRSVVLILTASLDGFIAESDGGIEWLVEPPEEVPADYLDLLDSIDCLIMGSATYLVSLDLEGGTDVFEDREVFVFTSRDDLPSHDSVTFVTAGAEEFVAELKNRDGGAIWLFGGGKLATSLSDAGLVDEYVVAVQPILLGKGIPLWVSPHGRTSLELVAARPWAGGIAELHYRRRA